MNYDVPHIDKKRRSTIRYLLHSATRIFDIIFKTDKRKYALCPINITQQALSTERAVGKKYDKTKPLPREADDKKVKVLC